MHDLVSPLRTIVLTALLSAAAASPAGAATLKGQVVGSPYLADSARTAVPVLFSKQSARAAHLRSPLGVAVVPRRRALAAAGGTVLPGRLRLGDRFTARASVSKGARGAVYPTLTLTGMKVTKRAKQLSTAELEELVRQAQKDLKALGTTVTNLAGATRAGLAAVNARVDGLVADIARLTGDLTATKSSVTSLTAALAAAQQSLQANIDQVRADLQPQITAVSDGVAQLVTQLGACNVPGSVLGRICGIESLLGGLNTSQLSSLTTTVNSISSVLTDTLSRLTGQSLGSLPASLTGTLGTALTQLGGLQGTVSGLSTTLGTVSTDLTTLTGTVGGITTQLGGVNVGQLSTTVGNLIGALGAGPTGLNPTTVTNLQTAMTTAQGQITGLTTLLGGVNVPALQSTVTTLQGTLSGVQTTVNGVCSSLSNKQAPVYNVLSVLLGNATLPTIPGC